MGVEGRVVPWTRPCQRQTPDRARGAAEQAVRLGPQVAQPACLVRRHLEAVRPVALQAVPAPVGTE